MENSTMKPIDKIIAEAISQFEVRARPGLDERVREHIYEAFTDSAPTAGIVARRWRLLIGNRIAQLATAAVIAVTALLGLHLWSLGGAEVYAVGQTIQALRKIETAHAFCTDWEGHKFEMWMKPDPVTGANDFICLTEAERDYAVISTPHVSYYYYPGRNLVRIVRGQLITSDLDLARMIESFTQEANSTADRVEIGRKTTDRFGDVITIHRASPEREYEAWIDPKTKLLLSLQFMRTNNSGEVSKSLDEIRYNEPVPDRLLHFECPDNAVIKPEGWGNLDDPNCGIDVTGLSDEQACRAILTQLFEAVNAINLDGIRRLIPIASQWNDQQLVAGIREGVGRLWDDQTPGVAAYEIGSPYTNKACPLGVLVPCTLTDHEARRFEVTLIVRFRQTQGHRTCVVVSSWGETRLLDR
jgi:hypothetical protein